MPDTPAERFAAALVLAEERMRARGATGAQAFDRLLPAIEERLGLAPEEALDSASREVAAALLPNGREEGSDLLGLAYERFFPDLFKGLRGQFFTPPALGELLVSRLGITRGDRALDPTCGSGGLLVPLVRAGARVEGLEIDPRLARLARLNLALVGSDGPVRVADFFSREPDPVDVLIANPPFSVDIDDAAVLERYASGRGRARVSSDRLFVEAIEAWVRPGGRAGLVLPFSILTNPSTADLRARIDRGWDRLGTCALPEGVFRPFGGAAGRAVLLWLRRGRSPSVAVRAWWADLRDPGYDVRLTRYRATSDREVRARCAGEGFDPLPDDAWTPDRTGQGRLVRELASERTERADGARVDRARVSSPPSIADLADADRATGELHPRSVAVGAGSRKRIEAGDIVVAQLRPNLGNVAAAAEAALGSPEWIVLRPVAQGHWLLHALRSPVFRDRLPVTGGQTRPRTSAAAVLDSRLPFPGDSVASRVDALSRQLHEERRAARSRLLELQALVDAFVAGTLDADGLASALVPLEQISRSNGDVG